MISRGRALRDALICGVAAVSQSPIFYAAAAALIATALWADEPTGRRSLDPAAADVAARSQAGGGAFDGLALEALLPQAQRPGADALARLRRLIEADAGMPERPADTVDAPAAVAAADPAAPDSTTPLRYLVFASEALGSGALAAIDALAAARGDMEVAFRGLRPGESIDAFAERRLRGRTAAPATIDPRPFRDHGVSRVPAILDRATGKLVWGVADPDAMDGRDGGEVLGSLVEVSEIDMATAMRERALAVDWTGRMQTAADTYFERARMERLAPAREARTRRIDARVRLANDFVLPDGRVVARAGDLLDPTELMPLTLTLVVFDPRDAREVDVVADLLPDIARPVLIASEIDPLEGWKTFERLAARLDEPVYLLKPDIRSRFALERTVSVVTGGPRGSGWFEVREIPRPLGEARG